MLKRFWIAVRTMFCFDDSARDLAKLVSQMHEVSYELLDMWEHYELIVRQVGWLNGEITQAQSKSDFGELKLLMEMMRFHTNLKCNLRLMQRALDQSFSQYNRTKWFYEAAGGDHTLDPLVNIFGTEKYHYFKVFIERERRAQEGASIIASVSATQPLSD